MPTSSRVSTRPVTASWSPSASAPSVSRRSCGNVWSGKALGPVLGWQDRRTEDVAAASDRLAARRRSAIDRQGCPSIRCSRPSSSDGCSTSSIPIAAAAATARSPSAPSMPGSVAALTGHHRVEAGNASRTQLLDLASAHVVGASLRTVRRAQPPPCPRSSASDAPVTITAGPLAGVPVAAVLADSHAATLRPRHPHAGARQGHVRNGQLDHGAVRTASAVRTRTGLVETIARQIGTIGRMPSRATYCPPGPRSDGWPSCSAAPRATPRARCQRHHPVRRDGRSGILRPRRAVVGPGGAAD